jgi:polyketide cyclase/dehydrase/lipid transport protein
MRTAAALVLAAVSTIPGDLPFSRWFTDHAHGIEVQIARVPGAAPWLKSVAEVAAPAESVFALVTDFRRYAGLFAPALAKARVLEGDASRARLHLVWRRGSPTGRRDAIALYRSEREPGGVFVVSWESDPRPRPGDPKAGTRRARVVGETRIEPVGQTRCRVSYTYRADRDARISAAAEEKAWKEEPVLYIRALRRGLRLPDPP